jgi:hypothetical protein
MDYVSILQDSIDTSVSMKIFKNREESSLAHIFKSKLVKLKMSIFNNVENFDPIRLKKTAVKAYPLHDRPRGNKDICSINFCRKLLRDKKEIAPVWLIKKNKKYILLDGAHRIVSNYIEGKKYINSYVIIL